MLRSTSLVLRSKSLIGAAALALIVSLASAQEQPARGRGGFGGRGFGGPGFGGPGGFNSPAGLLGMAEVRKELNVDEEQGKQIDEVLAKLREGGRGGFGNREEFQNLSDAERQARMEEGRKKAEAANKAADEKIHEILKPDQIARLNQLSLQRQGAAALNRPEVAKQLGITPEQREKIKNLQEADRPAAGRGNFQNLSNEERQKQFTQMRERQEKTQADILAVLTDEQRTKLTELKGKEFTFPQPRFGGGAGGERRRPATKQRNE